jgi:hypothetical protein
MTSNSNPRSASAGRGGRILGVLRALISRLGQTIGRRRNGSQIDRNAPQTPRVGKVQFLGYSEDDPQDQSPLDRINEASARNLKAEADALDAKALAEEWET